MIWLLIAFVSWCVLVMAFWILFRSVPELPRCSVGCYLDLATSAISHVPGCPNLSSEEEEHTCNGITYCETCGALPGERDG